MKLLLDTHILLWVSQESARLPLEALRLIEDDDNELLFSPASLWEIAIKSGRRADFSADARLLRRGLIDNGYTELPITGAHAVMVASLPDLHQDPFDRILIAQSLVEGITLLTADAVVSQYPGPIRRV